MSAGKKKPEEKNPDTPGTGHSLRDDAEEQLARSPKRSPALKGRQQKNSSMNSRYTRSNWRCRQRRSRDAQLALEESRDKYLDLYEFAPLGYLTLTDKALVTEVKSDGFCAPRYGAEQTGKSTIQ